MKEFFKIFLTNLIPPKEFLLALFHGVTIGVSILIPLILLSWYVPFPTNVYIGIPLVYVEAYLLYVGIKSWEQYKNK